MANKDNVVHVDFAKHSDKTGLTTWTTRAPVMWDETELKVEVRTEGERIDLKFSRPVETFRLGPKGTETLLGALAQALIKLKGE